MMKHYLYSLVLVVLGLLWLSSPVLSKSIVIKGNFKSSEGYSQVYLFRCFGEENQKLDSARLLNGHFEFKPTEFQSRGFYKIGVNEKMTYKFILDNSRTHLHITADLQDQNSITVADSKENDLLKKYVAANTWHGEEFKKLDSQAQTYFELRYSDPEKFKVEIGKLQKKLDTINMQLRMQLKDISDKNKGTFMGKVAGMFIFTDSTTQAGFFRKEEITDTEYANGDMLASKISAYMQRFYGQGGDMKVAASQLLSKFEKPNANKEIFYITLIKIIYQQDQTYARTITEQYGREFPQSTYAKFFLNNVPRGMPKIGDIPPDIQLKDMNGKNISLYSLRGKVVLLDFWASWCGPCRRENPNVVTAYQKFKDKGFTVFSVSLDNNRDQWAAAIKKDNLIWENHVSDLKGWQSDAAKLYGVTGIPAAFLIDKTGKIVGANLRGAELDQALERLFSE